MVSLDSIREYLSNEEFEEQYNLYLEKNKNNELINFINNIELNKKYYRLGIHKNKNKKFKNKVTNDTNIIREINSLINKITNKNYEIIKKEIIQRIDIDHIKPFIYEKLLENSILHHIYIPFYVGVLKDIHIENKMEHIIKVCEKYYNEFFKLDTCKDNEIDYEQLCIINKNIDNIIGFSLLISYLEKENIIDGFIEKVIDSFMENMINKNDIEIFKLLVSFENISDIHYRIIPDKYQRTLEDIKKNTNSFKIRYKIMDILKD